MSYNRLNNLVGWATFAAAFLVYALTAAPTASFWDCGEFIAVSNELEVPHPPGAPLYLMVGRLFAMLAGGNAEGVAFMVNLLSGLFTALAVLFGVWCTTILAKKMLAPKDENPTGGTLITILGSGLVAGLTMAFADTVWFSAVEAEVYAPSSMFITLVFWLMLKWEARAHQADHLKWLVLTAYVVGLSIGVHLMALVIVPGLALLYYFRRYKFSWGGAILTFFIGLAVIGFIQVGVIQKTWDIARSLELTMVGTVDPESGSTSGMGMPQGSGFFLFVVLLLGALGYGIFYAQKKKKPVLSALFLSIFMVYMGFTSYTMIFIRSGVNPPIDENNPENVMTMLSYLKREQYGNRPLLYGPMYNSRPNDVKVVGETYVVKPGEKRYVKDVDKQDYIYPRGEEKVFPRMHEREKYNTGLSDYAYINMVENKGMNQSDPMDDQVTGLENLGFYFKYQIGYMFMRYFLWNYVGRASDIQWGPYYGDWESGVMGTPEDMPNEIANSATRNHYFYLPLLLGLLGLVFHFQRNKKDATVLLIMWVMAGIGIATFLNMGPQEPRERDYAFVGAIQLFALWVGLGVAALADLVQKQLKGNSGAVATVVALGAGPLLMLSQNYHDHDRTGHYVAPDSAYNLLNSCKKDAILFTNGDNDTFPLWYIQEVEGVRTDVRIVNLSLANTDWYILQMKMPMNGAKPVPISYKEEYILGDKNQVVPVKERDVIVPVDKEKVIKQGIFESEDYASIADTFRFSIRNKSRYGGLERKSDMIYNILENVAKNGWDRPIYFATTIQRSEYAEFENYLQQEGLALRLVPKKSEGQTVAVETMYKLMTETFKYRGLNDASIHFDDNTANMVQNLRMNFVRLGDELVDRADRLDRQAVAVMGDSAKAMNAQADKYRKMAKDAMVFVQKTIPDNALLTEPATLLYYARIYNGIGDKTKAQELVKKVQERALPHLRYQSRYYADRGVHFSQDNVQNHAFYSQTAFVLLEAMSFLNDSMKDSKQADALMGDFMAAVESQPGMQEFANIYYKMRVGRNFGANGTSTPAVPDSTRQPAPAAAAPAPQGQQPR